MTQMTAAGAKARSIARWAWQDPKARAVPALEQVNELAARADPADLPEIRDAASMLSRLASAVNTDPPPGPRLMSAQLSQPMTVSEQIELAAIGHHHIPGTAYTFRHGWIPVVGNFFNDVQPGWLAQKQAEAAKAARKDAARAASAKLAPAPPVAGSRKLTPEHQALLDAHKAKMAKASAAADRASAPSSPTRLGSRDEALRDSGLAHYASPAQAAEAEAGKQQQAAADAGAKTTGEALQKTDPALAALAQPGASMAALKSYIDARVAAEVARQVGQITEQQHAELQRNMAQVHQGQQKLIAALRKTHAKSVSLDDHRDRTRLVMYNLFNAAGLAVAIGGITQGLSPVQALLASALVPVANTIHNYVRGL
jgi:hypothetical protein